MIIRNWKKVWITGSLVIACLLVILNLRSIALAIVYNWANLKVVQMSLSVAEKKVSNSYCTEDARFTLPRVGLKWYLENGGPRESVYLMLGRLENLAGCLNAGQVWLEQGYQRYPDNLLIAWQLGELYWGQDNVEMAGSVWRSAGGIKDLLTRAGHNALGDHNWAEAERNFSMVIAIAPMESEGYWGLGSFFYGQNRLEEAIQSFDRARSLGSPPAYATYRNVEFAHALQRSGQAAEAVQVLDVYKINGALADAIRGDYYQQTGQLDEAVHYLESSVRQSPQDPWSRQALAITYARQGQRESAIAQLQAALEFNPQFQLARNLLGCLSAAADPKQCVTP